MEVKTEYHQLHTDIETKKEFYSILALYASNNPSIEPHQTVKHEMIAKGDDLFDHMDVKVEEHQVEIETIHDIDTLTDIHDKFEHNIDAPNTGCDSKIDVKGEFPYETSSKSRLYSRKQLSDITNSHQPGKFEESENDIDTNTDVKVEEQLIQAKRVEVVSWEKQYQCKHCDKVYFNASILLEHQKGHLLQNQRKYHEENSYSCSDCYKFFDDRDQLVEHQKTHDKPYQCPFCENCFTQRAGLAAHNRIHTTEKSYQCSQCDLSFKRTAELIQHQKIHIKRKVYQCNYCEKVYIQKMYLLNHHRTTHPDKKLYKCIICSKGFNDAQHLARHKKIHTGEKPYQCSHCDKCFNQKAHLINHIRTQTCENHTNVIAKTN